MKEFQAKINMVSGDKGSLSEDSLNNGGNMFKKSSRRLIVCYILLRIVLVTFTHR